MAQAVAREMTERQTTEHVKQKTWYQIEMDQKRKAMAQPAWKVAMESQQSSPFPSQSSVAAARLPPSSLPGMPPLTTLHEKPENAEVVAPVNPDPASSGSEAVWDAWCELQESNVY